MSSRLLNIYMDKTERVGNWLQRPLRLEQKRYAALDAYCVSGCYRVVQERLAKWVDNHLKFTPSLTGCKFYRLDNEKLSLALHESALIGIGELLSAPKKSSANKKKKANANDKDGGEDTPSIEKAIINGDESAIQSPSPLSSWEFDDKEGGDPTWDSHSKAFEFLKFLRNFLRWNFRL